MLYAFVFMVNLKIFKLLLNDFRVHTDSDEHDLLGAQTFSGAVY
jgi:hypothetical protein